MREPSGLTLPPSEGSMVVLNLAKHYRATEDDMSAGVITRKGQVTIPIAIRRALDLNRGDRVEFVRENGTVRLRKAKSLVEQTAGMLSKYASDHVPTDAEMNAAGGSTQAA